MVYTPSWVIVICVLLTCFSYGRCKNFKEDLVKLHNTLRNIHASPGLKLDQQLSKQAQDLADEAAAKGNFESKPKSGSNTFMLCTTYNRALTAKETVEAWYDEVCTAGFSFEHPYNKHALAFTELIWKDTNTIGVGKSSKTYNNDTKCTFVVAIYRPPGNIVNADSKNKDEVFLENIQKGKFNENYCDKLKDNKRHRIPSIQKRSIRTTTYETHQNNNDLQLDKRSLYYRFPAKFLIDPITGQAKAVAPERANVNSYAKSQLGVAPTYDRSMYNNMPYAAPSPYTESSMYGQEVMPQTAMAYSGMGRYNYEGAKPMDTYTPDDGISLGRRYTPAVVQPPPSPIVMAAFKKPKVPRVLQMPSALKKRKETRVGKKSVKNEKTGTVRGLDESERLKLQADALSVHNAFRKIHGVPPLELDEQLCKESQVWAEENAANGRMKHSELTNYGENLAFRCTGDKSVASINDSAADWYREVCEHNYDFNKNDAQFNALHFTQLIWKESSKLGIGMATSTKDKMLCTYFVARYTPRGNMGGEFLKNAPKGSFDKTKTCDEIDTIKNQANPSDNSPTTEDKEPSNAADGNGIAPTPTTGETTPSTESEAQTTKKPNSEDPNNAQQDQDEKNYQEDAVKVMNAFRKIHDSPPLTVNNNLHAKAKQRADSFVTGLVKRSERKQKPGENVQVACNPIDKVLPPEEAIGNLYREVCGKNYTFEKEGPQNASHFTQMVWKSSTEVGVAYATKKKRNGNLCTVVVAVYEPVGNLPGEFLKNVKKGKYDRSYCGSINTIASAALEDTPKVEAKPEDVPAEEKPGDNPVEPKPDGSEKGQENIPTEAKPGNNSVEAKPDDNNGEKKPGDNPLEAKPDDNNVEKKPEDILGEGKPDENPGDKKPEENNGEKKPEDNLVEAKPDGSEKKPEDVPTEAKPGNNSVEAKPDDGNEKKPGNNPVEAKPDDKNSDKKPEDILGQKKPDENLGDKKPEENNGEKKPEDKLVEAKPDDNNDDNKPGENPVEAKPDDNGEKKPEDILGEKKPDENPGDKKPEENNGEKKPEDKLVEAKPDDNNDDKKPGENPVEAKPDDNSEKKPEDIFGEKKPDENLGDKKPEENNGEEKPEDYPAKAKPDDSEKNPGNTSTEAKPGNNSVEAKPDDNGEKKPEDNPTEAKPGDNPLEAKPDDNGEKKPEDNPTEAKPGDNPLEAKPDDNNGTKKPEDKPTESKPGDNPLEAKPDVDPEDKKPEDNKPEDNNGEKKPEDNLSDKKPEDILGENRPNDSTKKKPDVDPEDVTPDDKKPENDKKPEDNNGEDKPEEKKPGEEKTPEGEKKPSTDVNPEDVNFAKEGLKAHNALRSIHQSQPLVENVELTKKAKELAVSFSQAGDKRKRTVEVNMGENIEKSCHAEEQEIRAEEAVLEWWSKGFCDGGPDAIAQKLLSPGSQVVWNSSVEFGMAEAKYAENGKFCTVIVALYSPKGNIEGEFDTNVKEGDFDYNTMCDDKNSTMQIAKELLEKGNESDEDEAKQGTATGTPTKGGENMGETGEPAGGSTNEPSDETDKEKPSSPDSASTSDKPSTTEGSGSKESGHEKAALEAHNILRKIHDAEPMKLNDDMSASAAAYAKKIADSGSMEHSTSAERNGDGENLAMSCSSGNEEFNVATHVRNWYKEVCDPGYNFNSGGFSGGTGHFTQVVWKDSSELGIGVAKGKNSGMTCYYTVGRYRTAGNMQGAFPKNVVKGTFSKSSTCASVDKMLGLTAKRSPSAASKRSGNVEKKGVPLKVATVKGILRTIIQPKHHKLQKKTHLTHSKH